MTARSWTILAAFGGALVALTAANLRTDPDTAGWINLTCAGVVAVFAALFAVELWRRPVPDAWWSRRWIRALWGSVLLAVGLLGLAAASGPILASYPDWTWVVRAIAVGCRVFIAALLFGLWMDLRRERE